MIDISFILFWISVVITPFGAFLIFFGSIGMVLKRKDTKSKSFKNMQKITLIGLTIVCIGFGICGTIFATGNFH